MTAFRLPRDRSRRVRFADILLAAVAAFLVFPAASTGLGRVLGSGGWDGPAGILGGMLVGIGLTGLFAWPCAPVAIAVGWWASRTGWIGWASALCSGAAVAGLGYGLTFAIDANEVAAFVALPLYFGALYAGIGWLALRWLCPDVYSDPKAKKISPSDHRSTNRNL